MNFEKKFYLSKIAILSIFFKKSYTNSLINRSSLLFYHLNFTLSLIKNKYVMLSSYKSKLINQSNLLFKKEGNINTLFFTNFNRTKLLNNVNYTNNKLQPIKLLNFYFRKKLKSLTYWNFRLNLPFWTRLKPSSLRYNQKFKINIKIKYFIKFLTKKPHFKFSLQKKSSWFKYKSFKFLKYSYRLINSGFKVFTNKNSKYTLSSSVKYKFILPFVFIKNIKNRKKKTFEFKLKKIVSFFINFSARSFNLYINSHISNKSLFINLVKKFKETNYGNNIYIKYQTNIYTKYDYSFIQQHSGLRNYSRFILNKNKFTFSYKVKKIFYSFLRPNEYKNSIFSVKRQLMVDKVINSTKSKSFLFKKILFSNNNILNYLSTKSNIKYFKTQNFVVNNLSYANNSDLSTLNTYRQNTELRINRVRFKPGYQRLWRNFRLALAELISFKFLYQQQLTTYLKKFFRKLNQSYFSLNENKVLKVLIYSRLLPDEMTFNSFLKNGLIYINNSVLTNKDLFIYKNDLLRLEISNWYYIFFKWLLSTVHKRQLKFKKLVYRKHSALKYKVMKKTKQKSNYTPNWIKTIKYDFLDVKSFLEVDFFTLSVFCIYDYNMFLYYSPEDIKVLRYNIYRLYNWKYIT